MNQLFISAGAATGLSARGAEAGSGVATAETHGADAAKRDAILGAAARQFARYGYRKTSVGEIAAEAGVAAGTLYLYFKDKQDLFNQTVRTLLAPVLEELRTSTEGVADWPEAFRRYTLARARLIRERLGGLGVTYERIHEQHPAVAAIRQEVHEMERGLIAGFLKDGIASGKIAAGDPELLAQVFQSALNGLERQILEEPWDRIEAIVGVLIALAWNGLKSGKST